MVASASVSADFFDGLEAYDAGRYGEAIAEWRALAAEGHLDSIVAIAGLYQAGVGVARDDRLAVRWYRRAADCGHAVAQLNLGDLYSLGRGTERDLVSADVYLSLAASQGNGWAAVRRSEIREIMTAAQRTAASARLAGSRLRCEFRPAEAAGGGTGMP